MSSKTAMMQMLEFINDLGNNYESKMHAVLCQEKAIELLEVEKDQIEEANFMGLRRNSSNPYGSAVEYYEENYSKQDNG